MKKKLILGLGVILLLTSLVLVQDREEGFILKTDFKPVPWEAELAKETKKVSVPKTDAPPRIDGELNDLCWQTSASAKDFTILDANLLATEPTTVYLAYDTENLYLGFQSSESQMDNIIQRTKPEQGPAEIRIWSEDCVEIFLDTDLDKKIFFHLIINSLGAVWDAKEGKEVERDESWQSNVRISAKTYPEYWVLELAIPFKSFGLSKIKQGATWGLNLNRSEKRLREHSSWSPCRGGFQNPWQFGELIFGQSPYLLEAVSTGKPGLGDNILRGRIKREASGKGKVGISLKLFTDSKVKFKTETSLKFNAFQDRVVNINYPIVGQGSHRLNFALFDILTGKTYQEKEFSLQVPLPLEFSLDAKEYYLSDKKAEVEVKIGLGEDEVKRTGLKIELYQGGQTKPIREGLLRKLSSQEGKIRLNISSLPEGKYHLVLVLLDKKGKIVSESGRYFEKVEGPFDW